MFQRKEKEETFALLCGDLGVCRSLAENLELSFAVRLIDMALLEVSLQWTDQSPEEIDLSDFRRLIEAKVLHMLATETNVVPMKPK